MSLKEMFENDLESIYSDISQTALYKSKEIHFLEMDSFEFQEFEGTAISVLKISCPNISEGDVFTIDSVEFEVLSYEDKDLEYHIFFKEN